MSVVIISRGETAFITGDVIHHPVQVAVPELFTIAESSAEGAQLTRKEILSQLADGDTLLIGSHFSEPTAGYVQKDQGGYRLCHDRRGTSGST